jgi:very-short-patch-repair endonuclease
MRPEIERARELRRGMTAPEIVLWSRLKRLRDLGFHFRRQAPFRGYHLDFVCHTRRLVIEVDGAQHGDDAQADHDMVRDRILARNGYEVLRFWASDVHRDLSWVMDRIMLTLERTPSVRALSPSPDGEGGEAKPRRVGKCGPTRRLSA